MTNPKSSLKPISGRNKRPQVISALSNLAKSIGAGGKLPTMIELSKSLGVAIATLDDCLGILEKQGIVQRRHGSGIYVSQSVSAKRMGLVFGRNIFCPGTSPFYFILLQQCIEHARAHHFRFSFFLDIVEDGSSKSNDEDLPPVHQDLVEALRDRRLDCIAACNIHNRDQERWLTSQNVPVVSFASSHLNPHRIWVDYDYLIETGVETLLAQGCKTIGFISTTPEHTGFFRKALKKFSIRCKSQWIYDTGEEIFEGDRAVRGKTAICSFFAPGQEGKNASLPDGILVSDDLLARGVCSQLLARGIKLGQDVKVCSHSNKGSFVLSEFEEQITLLEIDPKEMVDGLFAMLIPLVEKKEPPFSLLRIKPSVRYPAAAGILV